VRAQPAGLKLGRDVGRDRIGAARAGCWPS